MERLKLATLGLPRCGSPGGRAIEAKIIVEPHAEHVGKAVAADVLVVEHDVGVAGGELPGAEAAGVVATLSRFRLQETDGRWLKLNSGGVILLLGCEMLFRSEWLG
jgi:hypothetical protein